MASSKPAGASERAISRMAGGWFGQNKILLMRLASLLREGNRRGQTRLIAVHAGGVTAARRVLDQSRVAGPEDVLRAIPEPDLELTGEDDHELTARRRVPVDEAADRVLAVRDLRGRQALAPLGSLGELDRVDVRLAVSPRVQSKESHRAPRQSMCRALARDRVHVLH